MTPSEVINKLMTDNGITQRGLAEKMGYSSQGTVSNRLKRDNMSISTFDEMLQVLGYELVVRPIGQCDCGLIVNGKE